MAAKKPQSHSKTKNQRPGIAAAQRSPARQGRSRNRRQPRHRLRHCAHACRGRLQRCDHRSRSARSSRRARRNSGDRFRNHSAHDNGALRSLPRFATCAIRIRLRRCFAMVKQRFGKIDVLVNNAGIAQPAVSIEQTSLEVWRDAIDTNLTGLFLCTRAALPADAGWARPSSTTSRSRPGRSFPISPPTMPPSTARWASPCRCAMNSFPAAFAWLRLCPAQPTPICGSNSGPTLRANA